MKGSLSIVSILLVGLVFSLANCSVIFQKSKECPPKDSLGSSVLLSHESNCTLFYICRNGEKILRICPLLDQKGNRLHFNPELQVCDMPENVNCESNIKVSLLKATDEKINDQLETTTPGWQNPKTCIGTCPDRDPEDHVILLKNKDCTKYCMCNAGKPIVNVCPAGLHFSLEKQVCTWPAEADCEDE